MTVMEYTPTASVKPFLQSTKFINLIVGPVGSTKTSAAIMKIAYEAAKVAVSTDGIRRSKCVWIRNTRAMLKDSSIPDFLKWFPEGAAGVYQRTDLNFTLKFDNVECEVMWRGLEDTSDVRRLLSLNLTFGVMDEFREISPDIYNALTGRIGRYPDHTMVPHKPEWGVDKKGNPIGGCVDDYGKPVDKIWGASNAPDVDSFWENLISDPPDNVSITIQPSGLSPEADWIKYLKDGFYENLAEGKSEDWIDVYIRAQFGKTLAGKPVFKSFNAETHVSKTELVPNALNGTVWVGIDNGLSPSAVIGQVDFGGRILVYDAIYSEGMGALRFCREKLKPLLAAKYPGYKIMLIADPACKQRAQTDEKTIVDIYKAEGLTIKTAKTNLLIPRIAAVDQYLTRTIDGKGAILMCPVGAKSLIQAMRGKYRYKTSTKGETADTPEKNHPWSDIADAVQYLCLHADGGSVYGAVTQTQARREVQSVSAAGWT